MALDTLLAIVFLFFTRFYFIDSFDRADGLYKISKSIEFIVCLSSVGSKAFYFGS